MRQQEADLDKLGTDYTERIAAAVHVYKRACKETERLRERSEDYELEWTAAAAGAWCANACARAGASSWRSTRRRVRTRTRALVDDRASWLSRRSVRR